MAPFPFKTLMVALPMRPFTGTFTEMVYLIHLHLQREVNDRWRVPPPAGAPGASGGQRAAADERDEQRRVGPVLRHGAGDGADLGLAQGGRAAPEVEGPERGEHLFLVQPSPAQAAGDRRQPGVAAPRADGGVRGVGGGPGWGRPRAQLPPDHLKGRGRELGWVGLVGRDEPTVRSAVGVDAGWEHGLSALA